MDPLKLLNDAIKAVPAVRYALGVAGIAAVVAIVLGLKLDPPVAVFGVLIVLGLMFVLVVFTRFAGTGRRSYIGPAVVLVWFYTVAVIAATTLFMTSYFIQWPLALGRARAASVISGSATVYDGFKFGNQSAFNFAAGEILPWGSKNADLGVANTDPNNSSSLAQFFLNNDSGDYTDKNATQHAIENSGIIEMRGFGRLNQVPECPEDVYKTHYFVPEEGHVYCVRTRDGMHFAKIRVSGIARDRIQFDYVYQPLASRSFR